MSIVHFTRFRVTAGREPAVLEARQASLRACQGSEPELRRAYLVRLALVSDDHGFLSSAWLSAQ